MWFTHNETVKLSTSSPKSCIYHNSIHLRTSEIKTPDGSARILSAHVINGSSVEQLTVDGKNQTHHEHGPLVSAARFFSETLIQK